MWWVWALGHPVWWCWCFPPIWSPRLWCISDSLLLRRCQATAQLHSLGGTLHFWDINFACTYFGKCISSSNTGQKRQIISFKASKLIRTQFSKIWNKIWQMGLYNQLEENARILCYFWVKKKKWTNKKNPKDKKWEMCLIIISGDVPCVFMEPASRVTLRVGEERDGDEP